MKTMNFFYAIGLAILLGACASENNDQNDLGYPVVENPEYGEFQDMENPAFEFVLHDSVVIDLPGDFIMTTMSDITTDPEGNMYFREDRQHKLISLSPNFEFRWMTGKAGRGPGDFERVTSMVSDGDHLIMGNISGNRIDLFDYDGNFIRSYNPDKDISRLRLRGVSEKGELIATTSLNGVGMLGKNVHVIKMTPDSLEIVNSFIIDESGDREIPPSVSSSSATSVRGNQILSSDLDEYSITEYDLNGDIKKKVARDFDRLVGPGFYSSNGSRSAMDFSFLSTPNYLPGGKFFMRAYWPVNVSEPNEYMRKRAEGVNTLRLEYRNSIDIFDKEGALLYSIEKDGRFSEMGRILHIDDSGLMYNFKTAPELMVYRYKIQANI